MIELSGDPQTAQAAIDTIKLSIPGVLNYFNEYLKDDWKMPKKWARLVNFVGGIGMTTTLQILTNTEPIFIYLSVVQGFLAGAIAGAVYDKLKTK